MGGLVRGKKRKPASKPSQRVRAHVSDRPRRRSSNDGKLARALADAAEARAHQAATGEILKVIANSPFDVQPVFDAIADAAEKIFGDRGVGLWLVQDGRLRLASRGRAGTRGRNARPDLGGDEMAIDRESAIGCAVLDRATFQVEDVRSVGDALPRSRALAKKYKYRAALCAPLLRSDNAIGALAVMREAPGAFVAKDVALFETFAYQAVIAIENARLFNETKEALAEQKASGEVLAAIAGSMSDAAPVFDRILEACERLFAGHYAGINVIGEDGLVHLAAYRGPNPEAYASVFPLPNNSESATAIAIAAGKVLHYPDLEAPGLPRGPRESARTTGARSAIVAPLLAEEGGIGSIYVSRRFPAPFNEREIARLEAFANQATIAIKNARLFNETKEALERQTATAEILKVIASSPSDVQPVFDAIAESAARLFHCGAGIVIREGDSLNLKALTSAVVDPATMKQRFEEMRKIYPLPYDPERSPASRAIASREIVEVSDYEAPDLIEVARESGRRGGFRSSAQAPMIREGQGIGMIALTFAQPGVRLNEQQRALLTTFADQAVIAIENVRLFNETKDALERQTATAEILKVISESPTDEQPVLDAIAESASRLFGCYAAVLMRDGDHVYLNTMVNAPAGVDRINFEEMQKLFPLPFDPGHNITSRTIATCSITEVTDTQAPEQPEALKQVSGRGGYRSVTQVPLVREGVGIGCIALAIVRPGFSLNDKQRALLQTFADQAVIAIENVRLFKELRIRTEALTKSVGQLTALGEVGQAISSTLDLEKVLPTIVSRAVQLTGMDGGAIYEYDEYRQMFTLRGGENIMSELVELYRSQPIRIGEGAVGGAAAKRAPVQIADIVAQGYESRARGVLERAGARALLAVPLLAEGRILGALAVIRNTPGEFPPEVVELLETFATQSAIAIQNAQLFREIEEKGRELQIASQHKSQFLASMSHELRTPLNAILGFNEMMLDGLCGEVPEGFKDPLQETQTSGKHLLRLINNVLDLAKIEAGKMELALADYAVQDMVEGVRSTLRPLAEANGLEFRVEMPTELPLAHGDSGRLTQCLMNLAGNSLKFTKEGHVAISVEVKGDRLLFRVADTGIGIPAEKIDSLFTEFKQTDATIASEYGGTGLGLAITRQFVEMHGGSIWVESEPGKGSTFLFEIPLRAKQ